MSLTSREQCTPPSVGEVFETGTVVGNYQIDGLHATAGYACVYRATNLDTGETVALKTMHEKLSHSAKHVERFRREYEALRTIQHPNIVKMLDFGLVEGSQPFFVMEWCSGPTLEALLAEGGFTLEEALPMIQQLVNALQAVHTVGMIHRDIKPANIILLPRASETPLLKLIDFGIATHSDSLRAEQTSLTSTGACIGTPHSMAPEQIFGAALGERTDVYAVGVVIYELLTGKKPFQADSIAEVVDMHLNVPPPKASSIAPVSPAIDHVIERCMAKRSEDRYPDIESVQVAFEKAATQQRQRPLSTSTSRNAIGVHVDFDFLAMEEDVDDEDFDRLDDLLEFAHEACAASGLRVALETGNGFLAVGLLPNDDSASSRVRLAAIEFARTVAREYGEEQDQAITLSIVVHAAPVKTELCGGITSFVGGDLLSVTKWSPSDSEERLMATAHALRGLNLPADHLTNRPGYRRLTALAEAQED